MSFRQFARGATARQVAQSGEASNQSRVPVAGHGFLVDLLLGHDSVDRQSLIEEKYGLCSPTFAPVAAALLYLRELAAFLVGERQRLGFAGQGEASGRLGAWRLGGKYTRISRMNYPEALTTYGVDGCCSTGGWFIDVLNLVGGGGLQRTLNTGLSDLHTQAFVDLPEPGSLSAGAGLARHGSKAAQEVLIASVIKKTPLKRGLFWAHARRPQGFNARGS